MHSTSLVCAWLVESGLYADFFFDDRLKHLCYTAKLNMTEAALKVAVHRMRRRFGVLLRAEVAHTVDDPDAVDEELHYLVSIVGS